MMPVRHGLAEFAMQLVKLESSTEVQHSHSKESKEKTTLLKMLLPRILLRVVLKEWITQSIKLTKSTKDGTILKTIGFGSTFSGTFSASWMTAIGDSHKDH